MVARSILSHRCVDGVFMRPHRLDALDAAVRESTRLARGVCDGVRATQDFGDGEKNPNLITPEKYAELVRRPSPFRRHRRDVYSIYAG